MFQDVLNHRKTFTSSKRLVLPIHHGFIFADLEDIVHCESDGIKSWIFLNEQEKSYLISRNIGQMEEMLNLPNFVRIHNAHIINVNFVVFYARGDGGSVIMSDGTEITISRTRKAEFLERISCV